MMPGLLLGTLCPWCAQPAGLDGVLTCGHQAPAWVELPITVHRLVLRYPLYPKFPALQANLRGNRWETNKDVQQVRTDVGWLAKAAGCRPGQHVTVHLAWSPKRHDRVRDEDNLWPLLKACCDGLSALVPDDSGEHMSKLCPRILPAGDPPGMWLTVIIHGGGGDENPHSS